MSLVNDALKKARVEAARGDAASRGVLYPALGRGQNESNGARIAGLGALVVLVGLGGFFLFRAGKQSALRTDVASNVQGSSSVSSSDVSGSSSNSAHLETQPNAGERDAGANSDPANTASRAVEPAPPRPEPKKQQPVRPTVAPEPPAPKARLVSEAASGTAPEDRSLRTEAANGSASRPAIEGTRAAAARSEPEPAATPPAKATEYLRSADVPGVGPIELGGIAWSGDRPFALLNGRVVRPGDSVSGLMVEEIQRNTVRLSGKDGDLVFKLK